MPTIAFLVVVVAAWVLTGLAAAVVLPGRRGYRGWRWYLIGAVLGLFFVSIATERAPRDIAVLERAAASPARIAAARRSRSWAASMDPQSPIAPSARRAPSSRMPLGALLLTGGYLLQRSGHPFDPDAPGGQQAGRHA